MGSVIRLGDNGNIKLVGRLGANLTKAMRAGFKVADGFIVPLGKHVGFGMSNEIQRNFDMLSCDLATLRSSPVSASTIEIISPVRRENLVSAIGYMQRNTDRRWEPSAIVVQKYLDGELCGTAHSHNPYTESHHEIVIEAKLWADNSVLGNEDEAEMILVNKKDGSVSLESNEDELILSVKQIQMLFRATKRLENEFRSPVSLDWGFVGGVLYILDIKPIESIEEI